jgi:hypothetical protein
MVFQHLNKLEDGPDIGDEYVYKRVRSHTGLARERPLGLFYYLFLFYFYCYYCYFLY